jgi:hypothetical protein
VEELLYVLSEAGDMDIKLKKAWDKVLEPRL